MRQFNSKIGELRITDFKKLDFSLMSFSERLSAVGDMILVEEGDLNEFFTTYFDEYYISSPSQNGYLAEQDVVCRTLESLGTYLLNAKDIQSNRKVVYRFWKSKREFNQYKESEAINLSTLQAGVEEGVEVIDLLFNPSDKNFRLDSSQRLFANDHKEIQEIASLQDGIDLMKTESYKKQVENHIDKILPSIEDDADRDALKRIRRNVGNYIDRWTSEMKDNQILIKEAIKRPIRFKNASSPKGRDNINAIELDDENVVKAIISNYESIDLTSEVGLLVEELNEILEEMTTLKPIDRQVINLFKEGYSRKAVVEELEIEQYSMTRIMNRIGKKVVEHYISKEVVF